MKALNSWCHDKTGHLYTKLPMKVDDLNLQNYHVIMAEQKDVSQAEEDL